MQKKKKFLAIWYQAKMHQVDIFKLLFPLR